MSWISKHVYMCDWRLEDRNKLKGWVCLSVYCICHAFFFIYYHCYLSISYLPIYIIPIRSSHPSTHSSIIINTVRVPYIYPLLISKKHKRQWKKLKLLSISRKTPWTPCFNPHFTTPPRVSTHTHTHTHTHTVNFIPVTGISLPRCVPLSSQLTAVLKTPKFWKRPNVIPKLAAAQKKAPALATYPNDNG